MEVAVTKNTMKTIFTLVLFLFYLVSSSDIKKTLDAQSIHYNNHIQSYAYGRWTPRPVSYLDYYSRDIPLSEHHGPVAYLIQYLDVINGTDNFERLDPEFSEAFLLHPKRLQPCPRLFDFCSYSEGTDKISFGPLFFKDAALLIGEEWITGQQDERGVEIEGGWISYTTLFLHEMLRCGKVSSWHLDLKRIDELSTYSAEIIESFLQKLREISLFEAVLESNENKFSKASFFANLLFTYVADDEDFYVPIYAHGFVDSHVMILQFKKHGETVDMTIFNTGDGLQYHDQLIDVKHLRYNFQRSYKGIPLREEILETNFFDILVEFADNAQTGEDYNTDQLYISVFSRFGKYEAKPSENIDDYSIPQRTGNCFQKVLMAVLKSKLGKIQFKIFERALKRYVLRYIVESKNFDSSVSPELFMRAAQNEARMLSKEHIEGKINDREFEERLALLKEYIQKIKEESLGQQKESHGWILSKEYFASLKHVQTRPFIPEAKQQTKTSNPVTENLDDKQCELLEELINDPMPSLTVKDRVIKSKLIVLRDIRLRYNKFRQIEKSLSPSTRLAILAKLVASTWKAILKFDPDLAKARLNLQVIIDPLDDPETFFYDPRYKKMYNEAIEYLKMTTNQDSTTALPLFDFFNPVRSGRFQFMPNGSMELAFIQKIAEREDFERDKILLDKLTSSSNMGNTKLLWSSLSGKYRHHAYLFCTDNEHVPSYFRTLKELLRVNSEFVEITASAKPISSFMGSLKAERKGDDVLIMSDSYPMLKPRAVTTENMVISKFPSNTFPQKIDVELLRHAPCSLAMDMALNYIGKYPNDLFSTVEYYNTLVSAVLHSSTLEDWISYHPLNAYKIVSTIMNEASKIVLRRKLVLQDNECWNRFLSLKYLLGLRIPELIADFDRSTCDFENVPVCAINAAPEVHACLCGPKPGYLLESMAFQWKALGSAFSRDGFTQSPCYKTLLSESLIVSPEIQVAFPSVKISEGHRSFEYVYSTGLFKSSKVGSMTTCPLFPDQLHIDRLNKCGVLILNGHRYELNVVGNILCKQINGDMMEYVLGFSAPFSLSYSHNAVYEFFDSFDIFVKTLPFEDEDNQTMHRYYHEKISLEYPTKSETNLAGQHFLTIEFLSKSEAPLFKMNGQEWSVNNDVPQWILNFAQESQVLSLISDRGEEKILINKLLDERTALIREKIGGLNPEIYTKFLYMLCDSKVENQ